MPAPLLPYGWDDHWSDRLDAFLASPLDKPRDCTWTWQPDEELFRAKCDEDLTAPADGAGLTQFQVTVADGRIDVDLNAEVEPTTTTTVADDEG